MTTWKCPICAWPNDHSDFTCIACGEKRCTGCYGRPPCWICEDAA